MVRRWRHLDEGTPTFTQVQSTLTSLGGDADVDQYLQKSRSNVQDLAAVVLELKAKAIAHEFESKFIYGDGTSNTITGIHSTIAAGTQQVNQGAGTTPAALSLANLDAMIDLIRPGKPDVLICSRRTRRGLSAYSRALTSPVQYSTDEFGQRVTTYDGIPVIVSDFILDTESISSGRFSSSTGGASTSIFALRFGENGVAGLQNGGLSVVDIGELETKDAYRYRLRWYLAVAFFHALAFARLDGISSAAVVA